MNIKPLINEAVGWLQAIGTRHVEGCIEDLELLPEKFDLAQEQIGELRKSLDAERKKCTRVIGELHRLKVEAVRKRKKEAQ